MAERDPTVLSRRRYPAYEADYAAWVRAQAELLTAGRFTELDLPNLVDEVESLGRSDLKGLVSAIEIVLVHMLKWDHQPERRTRSWANSIIEHRRRIERELKDSPSYRAKVDDAAAQAYETATARAATETGLPIATFADANPYPWSVVMSRPHELAE